VRDKVKPARGRDLHAQRYGDCAARKPRPSPVRHHERGHRGDHHALALHRAAVLHAVAVVLPARPVGGEEVQARLHAGERLRPGHDCEEAVVRATKEGGGEVVGTVRVPLQNPTSFLHAAREGREADALAVFIPAARRRPRCSRPSATWVSRAPA